MHRRAFLKLLGLVVLLGGWERSLTLEAAGFSFDEFLKLSAKLTGFSLEQLDRDMGRSFYRHLSGAQRELAQKLARNPNLADARAQAFATQIVTFWFTETGFESLAWKSLDFAAPPMTCHGEWWKSPT